MNDRPSLSTRIWKYRLHYVIVLPALLLLFLFKLLPFLSALIMPFKAYQPFRGLFGSPWAGTANFRALFERPEFSQVVVNTLALNIGYIAVTGVAALLLSLALAAVRWERLRVVVGTLFLLPYFVPSVVFAYVFVVLLSPDRSPVFPPFEAFIFADNGLFRLGAIAAEALKTVGLPALIALTAIASRHEALRRAAAADGQAAGFQASGYLHRNVVPAVRAVIAFALLRLAMPLASDFDLMHSLVNPLVFEAGETLTTYIFRIGFLSAQFSLASAAWLVQFVIQLLFVFGAYALLRGAFAADLFSRFERPRIQAGSSAGNVVGIAVSAAMAAIALLPLYVLFVVPLTTRSEAHVTLFELLNVPNAVLYGFLFIAATVVHMLMTVTLAYPLTVKRLPGRQLYKALLLVVAVMGSGTIHEYFMFRSLGVVNTMTALPMVGLVSIVPVFILKSIFNAKYGPLKEQYEQEGQGELRTFFVLFLPKVWKSWVALGVLQLATLAGAYQSSLLYLANPETSPPLYRFASFVTAIAPEQVPPGDPMLLAFGALVSLPGIVLLLLFRPWLTSEVLVGQVRKG